MEPVVCEKCGAELDPNTMEYCKECAMPVEHSVDTGEQSDTATSTETNSAQTQTAEPASAETETAQSQPESDGDTEAGTDQTACPHCGATQDIEQNYCRSCGGALDEGDSTTNNASQSPAAQSEGPSMWLDLFGTTVQLSDGDTIGADLRPIVAEATSRETALSISREQFEVAIDPDTSQCWLRDAGSTNGTVLNETQLPDDDYWEVTDGDTVVLPPDIDASLHIETPQANPVEEDTTTSEESPADGTATTSSPGTLELYGRPDQVVHELADGQSIGRGDQADVTIDGPTAVSRVHATVSYTPDGWVLTDQSTNESFVRRSSSQEWTTVDDQTTLTDGDEVASGKVDNRICFSAQFD